MRRFFSGVIPRHVGIIPDGNRRWAKRNALRFGSSYARGVDNIFEACGTLFDRGVSALTVYILSLKNLSRSRAELAALFSLLERNIPRAGKFAGEKDVRIIFCGRIERLPEGLQEKLRQLEDETAGGSRLLVGLVGYDGADDLQHARRTGSFLIPDTVPPIDLVIRTGGEKRLSGFPPQLTTYSELYFSDLLWPDFNEEEIRKALEWFSTRERRFGK